MSDKRNILCKPCGCADEATGRLLVGRCPRLAHRRQIVALPGQLYCGPLKSGRQADHRAGRGLHPQTGRLGNP